MINETKLKNLVSKILKIKVEKITLNTGMNNQEQWDSLAHLSILSELDNLSKGKASKIRGLSNAGSVKEILKLLKKNKLAQ
jgi:acyl carrier protein